MQKLLKLSRACGSYAYSHLSFPFLEVDKNVTPTYHEPAKKGCFQPCITTPVRDAGTTTQSTLDLGRFFSSNEYPSFSCSEDEIRLMKEYC